MRHMHPALYEFRIAPLNPPATKLDLEQLRLPEDFYDPGGGWFFVESVVKTSGGGSYPSSSASQGGSHPIGSNVMGLFAKRRWKRWSLDGKCHYCGEPATLRSVGEVKRDFASGPILLCGESCKQVGMSRVQFEAWPPKDPP